ncbi:hypothetical protein B5T_00140 [Alloalcanivorax dieselolei B5]|uniref:SecDF P1 head subdomain domain-containing protein n=1 Tax=Alcanivorax dieselolei (strain DSM 16502 / CGMCC 1.3690 / MCCC 1A00001 / B-5) TaxID=930169 RepID=K0C7B4_ALCDB|nr:hypothetical protein [Alloalcanivorax dieselolei]AFT68428.1 hypothetical protein B5T_00140 [Alloalcanivorax dieselolei B5]GGJ99760.1 hypothetical protein GCM10007426_31110 [Alloalcanivorax dieselolei]
MRILKCLPLLLLSTSLQAETVTLQVESAEKRTSPDTTRDVIDITLDPESRQTLADFTRDRVGQQIHLSVEGYLLTSPFLQSVIDTGSLRLSAGEEGFDGKTAGEIAETLNKGGALTLSDDH